MTSQKAFSADSVLAGPLTGNRANPPKLWGQGD